jgi:DnaJ-domain-containing protein 1
MGRLGDLLKSYLNSDEDGARDFYAHNDPDPDLKDAYDELNEFLHSGNAASAHKTRERAFRPETENWKLPPENLRADFAELGVDFGADEETCKAARKRLLKTYHPDRYAGDEAGAKKAAARAVRINVAYDNISRWRQ